LYLIEIEFLIEKRNSQQYGTETRVAHFVRDLIHLACRAIDAYKAQPNI
jgi:hypothetical protein